MHSESGPSLLTQINYPHYYTDNKFPSRKLPDININSQKKTDESAIQHKQKNILLRSRFLNSCYLTICRKTAHLFTAWLPASSVWASSKQDSPHHQEGVLSFEGPFCISVSTEEGKKRPREETRFFSLKSPLTTAWSVMRVRINLLKAKWLHYMKWELSNYAQWSSVCKSHAGPGGSEWWGRGRSYSASATVRTCVYVRGVSRDVTDWVAWTASAYFSRVWRMEVQGQGAGTVPLPGLPPCCILTWQRENSGLLLFLFTSKALIPSWGPTLMTYFKHN